MSLHCPRWINNACTQNSRGSLPWNRGSFHVNEGTCRQAPRLPRKVPRCQRRPKRAQARHQNQPSATSATPDTQNEGGRRQVPRLPCKTKVDVPKCHACHAKCRGVTGGPKTAPSALSEPAQCHKCPACHAKRRWLSRSLPRETKVDVPKCHACHAKYRVTRRPKWA